MPVILVEIQIVPSEPKIPPGQEQRHGYGGGFPWYSEPCSLWIYCRRGYCKQINVYQNPTSPQGCCEKETGTKQLVSSARQCTCTSVIGGQKVPSQAQCNSFGAFAMFLRLVTTWHLHVFVTTKNCSQRTIHKCWGSHCKSDESTQRGMIKWFPGILPKALWTLLSVKRITNQENYFEGHVV
jgi:hypothetical protein